MLEARDGTARKILEFWFGDAPEYGRRRMEWFRKDAAFDAQVRENFLPVYELAATGSMRNWQDHAAECLALTILLDQFPRNMFRDSARAFAADGLAREAAQHAIAAGYDRDGKPVERLFYYLPFEHSEALEDQQLACRLIEPLAAFPDTEGVFDYALRHRDVVRRFGRFPHRNTALGRTSTPEEAAFVAQPGSGF